jgi:hypothetical protein
MKLSDAIWHYVNDRVEEGILPSEDDIYSEFQTYFENGCDTNMIDAAVKRVVGCSDLTGVQIEWEGELYGSRYRRIKTQPEIPFKTA